MDPRDPIPTFIALQQQLPSAKSRRQRERLFRVFLWGVGVFALFIVTVAVLLLRFDPNAHRARIEAALRTAIGREVHINGRLAITSYRRNTLALNNLVIGNAPWATPAEMMRLGHVEADLDLLPLFSGRISIARLIVEDADIALQTDKTGRGNWQFTPLPAAPKPPLPNAGPQLAARAEAAGPPFVVRALHLRDSHFSWRDGRTDGRGEVTLRRLTSSENPRDNTISIGGEIVVGIQPVVFSGQMSSLARLLDPTAPGPPWGAVLTGEIPGMKATVAGTVESPLEGRGYKLRVDGVASDVAALGNMIGRPLPPLHNITFSGQINETAQGVPEVSNLLMQIGNSDLGSIVGGLKIETATIEAKLASSPVHIEAKGSLSGGDLRATADIGTVAELLGSTQGMQVDFAATLGESTLSVRGTVPARMSPAALDVAVQLRLRDLADISSIVGKKLPPMRPVRFGGRIAATEGGGIAVRDGALAIPQADVIADLDYGGAARPSLRVFLHGARLDVDALRSVFANISFAPPSNEIPLGALPMPRSVRPVISDQKLPLDWMDALDADLQMTLDSLKLGGMTAQSVSGQLVLRDGHLVARPVFGILPGGPFDMSLDLDSRNPAVPVSLSLHAPALDVRAMLKSMDRTEDISGLMEVDAELRGAGPSLHDMASSLTGHLGLAMVDGTIDNALLLPYLGGIMRANRVASDKLFGPPRSTIRCFATRVDSVDGHADVSSFVLDVGRALVRASGSFELGPETVDMRLRPVLRITAAGVGVPLKLIGRFRAMEIALDQATPTEAAIGPPSKAAGQEADACPAALALARGGRRSFGPSLPPPPPLLPLRQAPSR
jgi:uncharacterized protein involved in outer membrane biogenesis